MGSSGLTDEPIYPGETVHISVFNAPDFSTVTRVSQKGEIAIPLVGVVHIAGLSSIEAENLISQQLKERNFVPEAQVTVMVDSTSTGITVLGEVRYPGIYPPSGKRLLSDLLATAGGLTASTGRMIEISNQSTPEKKNYIPWDPTMHNTDSYDIPIAPGDRVLVRACGLAYVGGNVLKPGAYPLCGSKKILLSEIVALAGGVAPDSATKHTIVIRTNSDETRVVFELDLKKILKSDAPDMGIGEDDIVYVPPSALKLTLTRLTESAYAAMASLFLVYH
jgi:polysaccharide export outer membrane protein